MSGLSNSLELPIGNLDLTFLWHFVKVLIMIIIKIIRINIMINSEISYIKLLQVLKDSVFA